MLEDVKKSIIDRIGELAPEASAATLKILATTLETTVKAGKEPAEEKYFTGMLELFKDMQKQNESFMNNLPKSSNLSLADISKIINHEEVNNDF